MKGLNRLVEMIAYASARPDYSFPHAFSSSTIFILSDVVFISS